MSYNEPPPPPPPAYGGQPGYGAAQPKTSVMSIISLVTGILGVTLCCGSLIFSIAALILGVLGRKEIRESAGAKKGDGLALAGIITGAIGLVIGIVYLVLIFSGSVDFYYSDM